MKSKKLSLLLCSALLLLCTACVNEDEEVSESTRQEEGPSEVDPTPSDIPGGEDVESYTRYQRYYYLPYASDFSGKTNGGSFSKNGLTWTYTSCNPNNDSSDYKRGLQINSSGNTKGWTFSTDFGENVCLEDVQVAIATNDSFGAEITFGNYTIGSVSTKTQTVTEFDFSGNYYIGDSLTFTCTDGGSKSCYLKYIAFTIYTLPSSTLELTTDVSEGDYSTEIKDRNYSVSDVNTYYSSINDSMSGETLFTTLYSISTIKTKISYGDVRYCLPYTDQNVDDSSHLYGVYDGASLVPGWDQGSTWNREHVWPQSKLGESGSLSASTTDARSDLHNLRACAISPNSAKGDYYVDEKDSSLANTFYPNYGDTTTDHRGDVARICFYMYLMYRDSNGLVLSDNPASGTNSTYGVLSAMIKWNSQDPVDDFEKQRNNRIEEYQGNRNPFIDHPEYVDRLFS